MEEKIFNLFLIGNKDTIFQIGCTAHTVNGSDEYKTDFLLSRVHEDFKKSKKIRLEIPLSWEKNHGLQRLENDISLFEIFFEEHKARPDPFSIRTAVVNGEIKIDGTHSGDSPLPLYGSKAENELLGQTPFDYLSTYIEDGHFDIAQLLYDDHFEAIKILYNQGKLISSLKLLMIFIDTVGFLDAGYNHGSRNFIDWLNSYVDLSSVGITAIELWEFRNGVLHMTNTESSKNRAGHIDRLIPRVSPNNQASSSIVNGFKHLEILALVQAVGNGIGEWGQSFNDQRDKFPELIARYDTLMSDSRRLYFRVEK